MLFKGHVWHVYTCVKCAHFIFLGPHAISVSPAVEQIVLSKIPVAKVWLLLRSEANGSHSEADYQAGQPLSIWPCQHCIPLANSAAQPPLSSCCLSLMVSVINLTQFRITWEESLDQIGLWVHGNLCFGPKLCKRKRADQ